MNLKTLPMVPLCKFLLWSGAALGLSATALAGDLYKWVDDKGVVHYSDTPPPLNTHKAERLRVDGGVTSGTDADAAPVQPPPPKEPVKDNPPPAPPVEPPPLLQDTPENRARVCEQARSNLDLLQSKFQVADATGKPLDPATRQNMIAQAQQTTATACSNP